MKLSEQEAAGALVSILREISFVTLDSVEVEPFPGREPIDVLVSLTAAGQPRVLACEVKSSGQPRHVREGLYQLNRYLESSGRRATPVFIAPYLSPEARRLCRENRTGFLDLQGNVRLEFDGVFIERTVADAPPAERRELKSLFRPKSAQVLKMLFRDPRRAWRVEELAQAAGVSLGHVSNVRTGLLDREWGAVADRGLFLSRPGEVLDAWRDAYEPPAGRRLSFYTTLHGNAFAEAARGALRAGEPAGRAVFCSFSAAQWLAPFGRTGLEHFYADEGGLERLDAALQLGTVSKGENVVVTLPKDRGLLADTVEPAPGVVCTSAVQTYLDLWAAGERGREAAAVLRRRQLSWPE